MMTSENPKFNPNNSEMQDEEMDVRDRNALLSCRQQIIQDLDVRLIEEDLIQAKIIDLEQYEKIKSKVSGAFNH